MFSKVYRVTQKDFYAHGNISVEVRRGTVLLEYETGRYLWDGKVLQHVEVAVSCHCTQTTWRKMDQSHHVYAVLTRHWVLVCPFHTQSLGAYSHYPKCDSYAGWLSHTHDRLIYHWIEPNQDNCHFLLPCIWFSISTAKSVLLRWSSGLMWCRSWSL
jgi:hypothetical protein